MTFEEFEKAGPSELRSMAKRCFETAEAAGPSWGGTAAALLQAQFYMSAIERKASGRIALRDLLLEITVILLIGGEIWLAVKQGKDEDVLMSKQNAILTNLQDSTAATAAAMKGLTDTTSASGKTLLSLQATTETMNKGVHDQIDLFYDPSVELTFDEATKRLNLRNTGRSSITITGGTVQNAPVQFGGPYMVAALSVHFFDLSTIYTALTARILKGSSESVSVTMGLKNEKGREFVLNSVLFCVWDKDTLVVYVHTSPLVAKP